MSSQRSPSCSRPSRIAVESQVSNAVNSSAGMRRCAKSPSDESLPYQAATSLMSATVEVWFISAENEGRATRSQAHRALEVVQLAQAERIADAARRHFEDRLAAVDVESGAEGHLRIRDRLEVDL